MARNAKQTAAHAVNEKRWRDKRKAEFWADKVCSECGTSEDLCFHHPNGVREDSATRKPSGRTGLWYLSKADFERELQDVVIVCVPCHKAIHAPKHGTRSKYVAGCRCEPCSHANLEYLNRPDVKERRNAAKRRRRALAREEAARDPESDPGSS